VTVALESTTVDARAERRATARRNPDWSLAGTVEVIERFVHVLEGHTADGYGGLAELAAAVRVHAELGAVIDAMAAHLLANDDCSYREVGVALGVTAQAAAKRFPASSSRRPGGQPAHLR
jgi:hypothetical protein